MNDTEILDQLMKWMKPYVDGNIPAPPVSIGYAMTWIAIQRGDQRKAQRKAQDAPKAIKPQAERDDWRKPQIQDTEHPHPYGAAYRQTHPALHTSECQRHNVVRLADGKYPSCGCNKPEPLRSRAEDNDLRHTQGPDVGKHKHAWFDNTAAGAQKCGWYGCDAVRGPGGFVYRTLQDYHNGSPYAMDTAGGGFKLIGDAVAAKDATPATSTHARIGGVPIRTAGGPYLTAADVQWGEREKRMASDILNRAFAEPEQPQAFWRCKHYPSAIHNWWTAEQCEWGCHNHPPTWDSNGDSK
jgi:hypothetical protein